MINAKIDNKEVKIPTQWEEVTYNQYIMILIAGSDISKILSVFTDIEPARLKKAKIVNLEQLITCLSFMNTPPPWGQADYPRSEKLGSYKLPKDITFESLGQFEDLRSLLYQMPSMKDPTLVDTIKMHNLHLEACAIYLIKVEKGHYDSNYIDSFKIKIMDYPCVEVMTNGAFFIIKPHSIIRNTSTSSPATPQPQKKKKQALIKSAKSSVSRQRSTRSRKK